MSVCIMSVCEHIHFTCACVCVDTQQSFLTINNTKLQALVYNILSPTTTITGYATVSENCQFFTGTQMAIRLLQTSQIISGISIITAHAAYSSTNKTKTVSVSELKWNQFVYPAQMCLLFMHMLWHYVASSLIHTQTFQRALTALVTGQMCTDKERPFSSVTNYVRVWRKGTRKWGLECESA